MDNILTRYSAVRESLIPLLQDVQEKYGYLSKENIYKVSDYLNLPEAKIFGVATFYNQFKLFPPGKYNIQICRGTACHVKGSFDLLETLKTELKIASSETSKDGMFSIQEVACLGACSIAPVIAINNEFFGRLSKDKLLKILKDVRTKESGDE